MNLSFKISNIFNFIVIIKASAMLNYVSRGFAIYQWTKTELTPNMV